MNYTPGDLALTLLHLDCKSIDNKLTLLGYSCVEEEGGSHEEDTLGHGRGSGAFGWAASSTVW